MRQLDAHMAIDENREVIVCRDCEETICAADENYKRNALCERKPLTEAGPLVNDPEVYIDEEMEFRQFYCPGCGTLLENEVIRADIPPVHDKELQLD